MMSHIWFEAPVKFSEIRKAIPAGADYADVTFEVQLFHEGTVVSNGIARAVAFEDPREHKPIRGEAIPMSDLYITRTALLYDCTVLAESDGYYEVKKGQRIIVDWWIAGDEPIPEPPGFERNARKLMLQWQAQSPGNDVRVRYRAFFVAALLPKIARTCALAPCR